MSKLSDPIRQRKLRLYFFHFKLLLKYLFLLLIAYIIWNQSYKVSTLIKNFCLDCSTNIGFKMKEVRVNGVSNFEIRETLPYIKLQNRNSIFSVDLGEVKEIFEANQWVRDVIVRRELPNRLVIDILERKPFAIWQYNKTFYLIDENGYKITTNVEKFQDLLHLVGEGADIYAASLVNLLKDKPQITSNIKHAIFQGLRRWDLIMRNGMIVKMPEHKIQKALIFLHKQFINALLPNDRIKILDMRNEEKYYIEPY
ncbi:cell division protein FtsQ/DivIB [Candidatus Phycorickettsia trachydisci]|nr:FtsQ-type POTRA domain-containing protein [Candidatus Phycorickettsia trachydisci]